VETRGSAVTNGQGGNNDGIWEIQTVNGNTSVEVQGKINAAGATVEAINPTRIEVDPDGQQFRYPDDLGKVVVISGSSQGNDGSYVISDLFDPYTLVNLASFDTPIPQTTNICEVTAATFVTETGLDWRLNPSFVDETPIETESSDAGSFIGTTLTLREAVPHPTVLQVAYSQVLSALVLLNFSVKNGIVQTIPTVLWEYYPFYLSDPLGYIRAYLDDITAAGVIPEYTLE